MEKLNAELKDEVASASKDVAYASYDGLLQQQDPTILTRGGGKGLKLYDEVERDPQIHALLQKRTLALVSKSWRIEPASDSAIDVKAAELVQKQLKQMNFVKLCMKLLDANLKGFSVAEIMWEHIGGEIVAKQVRSRNQNRFAFATDSSLRLLTTKNPSKGEEVPLNKFIVHTFGEKDENPYGIGLGSKLYWIALFKRQSIKFWLIYSEKFGNPTAVGKYKNGTDAAERKNLMDALRALSNDTAVTVPESMTVELLEAKRSGSFETYEKMCTYMDKQMSIAVLGETMTTDVGSAGSKAAGQVHNEIRLEIVKADAIMLDETLKRDLIRPIVEFNLPLAQLPEIIHDLDEEEDLNTRAERDEKICKMGYKPTQKYMDETYGIGFEPVVNVTPTIAEAVKQNDADFAEAEDDKHLSDQIHSLTADSTDELINKIKLHMNNVNSLEELRDALPGIYQEMDVNDLANLLSEALIVSELTGQSDAMDEGNK